MVEFPTKASNLTTTFSSSFIIRVTRHGITGRKKTWSTCAPCRFFFRYNLLGLCQKSAVRALYSGHGDPARENEIAILHCIAWALNSLTEHHPACTEQRYNQ